MMQWYNDPCNLRDIEQNTQDDVQPRNILYNIHKNMNADTVVCCTNISIHTQI